MILEAILILYVPVIGLMYQIMIGAEALCL